ncbi:Type 1 glutamine amidotransferase-like domain-containing protein [Ruminococcus sp. CLA-AA-H200]|uniref:Type 1 glutamine amidotransferase-like domain-containing protein n=1 Tax=Ruminococcus turbiniformis TaxID=2881258 RepID=A0ABS8G2A6_9FIRM|nr:Type 1 glutamine amidotransferase-like domain-containing protein [Ruminococcus turbiniformis]MCC2255999.1 Type 1 glutamine amidotransferase-like domain-containing protein [Ruminococcus turbiniformis]
MKKILLVSMLSNTAALVSKAMPELKGKTVTYIPTAGIAEMPDGDISEMTADETKTLQSLGLTVDVLEVSSAAEAEIDQKLTENDVIYIGGGNTFFLLQELRRSGADKILIREVNSGKPYIGESAGAVIACPDIGYCSGMDDPAKAPELNDYTGLGLVDFYVVPHLGNEMLGAGVGETVEKYSGSLDLKVITDDQMILVTDNEITISDR